MEKLPNIVYIEFLNPYSPFMNMFLVEIPEPPEPEPKPDYTINDFLALTREFEGYIGEGATLQPLFNVYKKIAVDMVNFQTVGEDEETWKMLVSLYIGHHMQMAMGRLKNQADEISLTPEKAKDKKITYRIDNINNEWQSMTVTNYGVAFYQLYMPYARNMFRGIVTNRGFKR